MKIAFIITRKRNNVVVSFGTLKVQSFMLTEVRDCDLLTTMVGWVDRHPRSQAPGNGGSS